MSELHCTVPLAPENQERFGAIDKALHQFMQPANLDSINASIVSVQEAAVREGYSVNIDFRAIYEAESHRHFDKCVPNWRDEFRISTLFNEDGSLGLVIETLEPTEDEK